MDGLSRALGCLALLKPSKAPPPAFLVHMNATKFNGCHQGLQLTITPWWRPSWAQRHSGALCFGKHLLRAHSVTGPLRGAANTSGPGKMCSVPWWCSQRKGDNTQVGEAGHKASCLAGHQGRLRWVEGLQEEHRAPVQVTSSRQGCLLGGEGRGPHWFVDSSILS